MSKAMQRALGMQLGLEDEGGEALMMSEAVAENSAIDEGAVEVADATDEVIQGSETVVELSEAASNLEEVSEAIVAVAEGEGVTQEAAVFMHLAIKNACGRFYGPAFASAVPSVESFSGSSGRRRNALISVEGVGQMLKSFWEAIKRQMKKLWATVKNWYLRVLDQAPRLKKKAQSLIARAGEAHGTPEEKDFDMGNLHTLNLDGKAPPLNKAVEMFGKMAAAADDILGDKTKGHYENIGESFEKLVEDAEKVDVEGWDSATRKSMTAAASNVDNTTTRGDALHRAAAKKGRGLSDAEKDTVIAQLMHAADEASARVMVAEYDKLMKDYEDFNTHAQRAVKVFSSGTVSKADRFGDDVTYTITESLFGGSAIVALSPKGKQFDLLKHSRRLGFQMTTYAEKPKDVDSSGTFKTMGGAEIRRVCEAIMDICDAVITYRKSWESRDKQQDKIDKVGGKAIDRIEKDKEAAPIKVKFIRTTILGMTGFWQKGVQFDASFINYLLKVSSAGLNWCERSIAQYK